MNRHILCILLLTGLFAALPAGMAVAQLGDEAGTARLARIYEDAGKYEDALRYYESLMQAKPSDKGYFDGAYRCLVNMKDYPRAIALTSARLQKYPNDPMLLVQRGSARISADSSEAGYADWEAAVSNAGSNPSIYAAVADEATNMRMYDKALDYLQRGEDLAGQPQLFTFKIARVYAMNNQFREAMREYVNYLVEVPSALWQVQQYITQFSSIPNALNAAMDEAAATAAKHRDNDQVQYLHAWLCMEAKDYESALDVYKRIDKTRNRNGAELLDFGRRAFNEGAFSIAQKTFKLLMDEHPEMSFAPEAQFYYARSIEEANTPRRAEVEDPTISFIESLKSQPSTEAIPAYEGAITQYESVRKRYPDHPVGFESAYRIGYIKYHTFHDHDGALAVLQEVADRYRNVIGTMNVDMLIGDILLAGGDIERALEKYEFVAGHQKSDPQTKKEAQFRIAEARYFQGDFDKAEEALAPLTEITQDDVANDALDLNIFIQSQRKTGEPALKQYARAQFLERQGKFSEAAAMMQDVAVTFPVAPIIDHAMFAAALNQRKSGNTERAKTTLEEFLLKFTDSILRDKVLFSLGDIYEYDLNNSSDAIHAYARILADHPNSIYSNAARKRILALREGNS